MEPPVVYTEHIPDHPPQLRSYQVRLAACSFETTSKTCQSEKQGCMHLSVPTMYTTTAPTTYQSAMAIINSSSRAVNDLMSMFKARITLMFPWISQMSDMQAECAG
ncbi:uncharacterized protein MCYG_05886 [Microsporum canis CBS 113480]|uniref:Uncharacterized protein n=1 Tax=Arthroderma otae (strain ATCC MYA-4605 / CBS 113480) TaxID=554155 RepID=C5FT64_ARTOC|nr:uncharacterized protein MCYG_05886 [Microsporum canis CBS 113480]EEQ33067.1 predicted protein [Microsporum canis CBS 113480]